ncbi:MAG: efflux RND transporter periplasmic adaptor subunit [Geopsychrobacter sp.]|nr:efflux RND transporter periplasmic adaptor subunit [Geopsychrobacter sp.]
MTLKPTFLFSLIVLMGGLILPLWALPGCAVAEAAPRAGETQADSPLISLARPELRIFTQQIPFEGQVEAKKTTTLTATLTAQITAIKVEDQARVKEGQLLVLLGGYQVTGERSRLTTEVESLKAQLELVRQTQQRVKKNLQAQLATNDQLVAVQSSLIKIETQWQQTQAKLALFEKSLRITAPISGTFTRRQASVGQRVNAGQLIAEIIDTDQLRIAAFIVPPVGLELQGRVVRIRWDEKQPVMRGIVRRVLPQDSNTGALKIWIEAEQLERRLRPGQTVAGRVMLTARTKSLAIPQSAIIYDSAENPTIFIPSNGDYVPQQIQLGQVDDGWAEVLSGLSTDQTLVTQGAYELFYRKFNEQFKVAD